MKLDEDPYLTDLFVIEKKEEKQQEKESVSPVAKIAETLTKLDKEDRDVEPEAEEFNARYTRAPDDEVEVNYRRGAIIPGEIPNDIIIYRTVVYTLAGTIGVCLTGCIGLSLIEKPVPDFLIVTGSGAIGSLGGLLVPSPSNNRDRYRDNI